MFACVVIVVVIVIVVVVVSVDGWVTFDSRSSGRCVVVVVIGGSGGV